LIEGPTAEARLARVVDAVSASARRPLDIDGAVFDSECSTGHRNCAIGHPSRNDDILRDDPGGALGLHFRQCALLVDCHDLALMAATLANGGVNSVTRSRAVAAGFAGPILSVLTTCGVHDFTGEWVTGSACRPMR
jgi:glutaminase